MRKLLALILLAGVAAPALAAGDPGDRPARNRDSASEDRGDRGNRAHVERSNRGGDDNKERSQPVMRVQPNSGGNSDEPRQVRVRSGGSEQPAVQVESHSGGNSGEHRQLRGRFSGGERPAIQPGGGATDGAQNVGVEDRVRTNRGPRIVVGDRVTTEDRAPTSRGPRIVVNDQINVEDRAAPTLRRSERPLPAVLRNRVPIVSNTPSEGTQPPRRIENRRRSNWVDWSTSHWRRDKKYDWKDHRRRHRSLFHLGFYYDPFGWNYRPYQIGWRLWPSYYSSRFWINDTWQYRLPYAPPGYRWIRYYDDAILIDTWDGRVVDVIYNFFW